MVAAAAASSSSSSLSTSPSSSVSSNSSLELEMKNKLKRKYAGSGSDSDPEVDSDNSGGDEDESTGADSGSDSDSDADSTNKNTQGLKNPANEAKRKQQPDEDMEVDEQEEEVKILSHKEQRHLRKRQKREQQLAEQNGNDTTSKDTSLKKTKVKQKDKDKDKGKEGPRRQNSIWVGNLAFRTTPDTLRTFFTDAGELTRVNMPMKVGSDGKEKVNRGFAYVDFLTPEAKVIAITLSEKNLDGRRLLIKDGDDFTGRPTSTSTTTDPSNTNNNPSTSANANANSDSTTTGHSKTVQKILSAQKQPPCPCLFLGNLGFEATPEGIREMFEGHARKLAEFQRSREKKNREKGKKKGRGRGRGKDDDLLGVENEESDGEEEDNEVEEKVEVDVGIKKVRMGTFEDSGMCKGFAFVDFTSTQHATSALTNPRNHFLDGRALVVEYASPDAARRGGYREKSNSNSGFAGRKIPKRGGENKYGVKKRDKEREKRKREADENDDENANEGGREEEVQDGNAYVDENAGGRDEPKAKRQRNTMTDKHDKEGGKSNSKLKSQSRPTKRPKPGAALALAQREKYAIVPSEGTRMKFS